MVARLQFLEPFQTVVGGVDGVAVDAQQALGDFEDGWLRVDGVESVGMRVHGVEILRVRVDGAEKSMGRVRGWGMEDGGCGLQEGERMS